MSKRVVMKKVGSLVASSIFSPFGLDRDKALLHAERISATTHLVSSLEYLSCPELREQGGMNDWRILRASYVKHNGTFRKVIDFVSRERVTKALLVSQAVASLVVLSPTKNNAVRFCGNGAIFGTSLLLNPRSQFGTDGSDQASNLVQGMATVARGLGNRPKTTDAALWAISLQSVMSYSVSGVAKLFGESWREGRSITGVARTISYGNENLWLLAKRFPRSTQTITYLILGLEVSYPLVFAFQGRLAKTYLASATILHVGIGHLMALGRFVPAFCSMHPAVAYTTIRRSSTDPGSRRDETFPRVTAILLAGEIIWLVAEQRRISKEARKLRDGEQLFVTSHGAELPFRITGQSEKDAPLFVLENLSLIHI